MLGQSIQYHVIVQGAQIHFHNDSGLIKMSARSAIYAILFLKKYRILTFRDKTESYLTVLQQNNAEAC